jgi:nucleotide-binding universal stress UspA family protein
MVTRILVPTDGSDTARKAAKYAFELAGLTHATVTLLSVIDRNVFVGKPNVPASETPTHILEPLEDYLREAAEKDMEEIEALGREREIKTKKLIKFGHPVEEILKEAKAERTDLIVMGSHGKSALRAALLGSVTFGVVHHETKIPVLIIRK